MSEMAPEGGVAILPIDITEIVGDLSIPCEYHRLFECGPAPAGWLLVAQCGCGVRAPRLTCEGCKNNILAKEDGLRCPSDCGEVFIPARKAFSLIEPL